MTENAQKNHYDTLGVERGATPQQIRAAYRKLAAQYHPDTVGDDPVAKERSAEIGTAFSVLGKESSRATYDMDLRRDEEAAYAADDSFAAEAPSSFGSAPSFEENLYDEFPDENFASEYENAPAPARRAPTRPTQARPAQASPTHPAQSDTFDPRSVNPFDLVDTSRLSWMNQKFEGIKERVVMTHPHRAKTNFFALGFAVSILLSLVVLFADSAGATWLKLVPLVGIAAMGYFGQNYVRHRLAKIETIMSYVATIIGYGLSIFVLSSGNHPAPSLVLALLNLVILGAGVYAATRAGHWAAIADHIKHQRGQIIFKRKDLMEGRVWGHAGQVGTTDAAFSDWHKEMGALGEKHTEKLMAYLLEIPGTRVFHCLRFPNSKNADVDHVVINGNKVAIIDSKMYQGAKYSWDGEDYVSRAVRGWEPQSYETHFPKAVRELRNTKFYEADVRAWMTIYSNDGAKVQVDNSDANLVRLATPQRMIEEIGAWFAEDMDNLGVVNKGLMNAALTQLKLPEPEEA